MYTADTLDLITSLEQKECDDCGKKEVEWASVKKGTVICSECFCFHSYLGPSVSYLRHLRKSAWDEEHIRLVHALNTSNTNMIWESALYEGSTKFQKPLPQDPSHIKEQFVKEKYEKMTFQPKRGKDEDLENSLNRQLIACVRSDYAHVTLRLIALGADVNYPDPENGDTALHVAAREGNFNQVELLYLYGADIMAQNKDGQLPYIAARDAGYGQLSQRIYTFFFYVFDRFSFFMCNRKADHKNNQDFFIPEVTEKQFLTKTKDSRAAISVLPKGQFFDLCEDAFDETVRRENEVNWNLTKWAKIAKGPTNLFLPSTTQMSAARNQRRQKLAKFTPIQFTILLIDLIKDQKRRITGENPLPVGEQPKFLRKSNETPIRIMKKVETPDYDEIAGISCSPISGILPNSQSNTVDDLNSRVWDELLEMKERLQNAEKIVVTVTRQNEELTKLVHSLQAQHINFNSELISYRDDLYNIKRTNMTRRMPSPLAIVETPERVLPPSGIQQSFSRRDSEDRIDGGGARWRSNSSDRRNSNDHKMEKKVERRQDSMMESSSSLSRSSQNPNAFNKEEVKNKVILQSEKITRHIKILLQHGHNGNLDMNASHGALEISCAIHSLISILTPYVRYETIDLLKDAVVLLNAKCNSPLLNPLDVIDAAQTVAEKLRLIIIEIC
ncbi:hypothetical protein GCK72_023599 [Caenorhabditis remanei]|uniref:Arf-GAP domain-containing protein n=1 Tax=Caenorhabditis remanei TaxID=31234 RepID=A0A6A5FXM7_CAERE|nr:hypothetical protein GCK72_023599 [Caenorhabditis remanei]KAF1747139.1 hypothetical protein GCK72_023599 [Caenorhabditis remanei]